MKRMFQVIVNGLMVALLDELHARELAHQLGGIALPAPGEG